VAVHGATPRAVRRSAAMPASVSVSRRSIRER
jgi:hypothetical protein